MRKLTEVQLGEELSKLSGWVLKNGNWIERKYRFTEFLTGISFVQKIANISEENHHHPLISIDYKVVTLKLSSWQSKGLTNLDIDLAHLYNKIYTNFTVAHEEKMNIPAHLRQYVVGQRYEKYTPIDQAVWRYVMRRNHKFLKETAHTSYINGLRDSGINIESIPKIEEMNACLKPFGWGAVTIDGFIPGVVFFDFQARGILPIAAEIRKIEHVNYTPAPDIIHEAAGHAPILCDAKYAEYVKLFGRIGSKALATKEEHEVFEAIRKLSGLLEDGEATLEEIQEAKEHLVQKQMAVNGVSEAEQINRLYWWTVEYGLIGDLNHSRIYGAGLLSSVGESVHSLTDQVKKIPFDLETAIQTKFDITTMQPQLFICESFDQLISAVEQFSKRMAYQVGGTESLLKGLASGSTAYVTYSSGLQVTGTISRVICDDKGEAIYLQMIGPSALSIEHEQLPGHGTLTYLQGFGSPIGRVQGFSKGLELYTEAELEERNLKRGKRGSIIFESGLEVKGVLKEIQSRKEKIVLISFDEVEVTYQDQVLYTPDSGTYHMAVGEFISSVAAGAAVPERYYLDGDFNSSINLGVPADLTPLEELYGQIRSVREGGGETAKENLILQTLEQLNREFSSDWLLRLEILELISNDPKWVKEKAKLISDLKTLQQTEIELESLIVNGLNLIEIDAS